MRFPFEVGLLPSSFCMGSVDRWVSTEVNSFHEDYSMSKTAGFYWVFLNTST
jgi:hypothetical protein